MLAVILPFKARCYPTVTKPSSPLSRERGRGKKEIGGEQKVIPGDKKG